MKQSRGFTLIELLTVIAIITIMSVVAITALNPLQILAKTRDNHRKLDLKSIQGVLEMYYSQNKTYPATGALPFGGQLVDSNGIVYLKMVPQDPTTGWNYCYTFSGANYVLCSAVEDASNVYIPSGVGACTPTISGSSPGVYCVTNPF